MKTHPKFLDPNNPFLEGELRNKRFIRAWVELSSRYPENFNLDGSKITAITPLPNFSEVSDSVSDCNRIIINFMYSVFDENIKVSIKELALLEEIDQRLISELTANIPGRIDLEVIYRNIREKTL